MAFNNIITFLFQADAVKIIYLECNLMLLLKSAALKMASDFNGQTNAYAWFILFIVCKLNVTVLINGSANLFAKICF